MGVSGEDLTPFTSHPAVGSLPRLPTADFFVETLMKRIVILAGGSPHGRGKCQRTEHPSESVEV